MKPNSWMQLGPHWSWPEAEFLEVIETKVFRVFLLAIHSTSINGLNSPNPLSISGLKLVFQCKNCIRSPQVWELLRLCLVTSTKFYVHKFGFCTVIVHCLFMNKHSPPPLMHYGNLSSDKCTQSRPVKSSAPLLYKLSMNNARSTILPKKNMIHRRQCKMLSSKKNYLCRRQCFVGANILSPLIFLSVFRLRMIIYY